MMKLAFSTNAYTKHDLAFALRDIAAAGYHGVEVLADRPHAYIEDMDSANIESLGQLLGELQLGVSNVNANCTSAYWSDCPPEPIFEPALISDDESLRKVRSDMIRRTIDMTATIGGDCISITTGKALGRMDPAKSWDMLKRQLAPLLEYGESIGVKIGIEQEPGLLIEWAEEVAMLCDQMGSDWLGANFDTGHSAVMGEKIIEALNVLRGRIWNVHVEDLPAGPTGKTKHYHCDPGTGEFDFEALFAELFAIGYDRYVTVELYTQSHRPGAAARAAMAHLHQYVEGEKTGPLDPERERP